MTSHGPNVWVDVEDLFEYRRSNPRPSGIQRVVYELLCGLRANAVFEGRLHFVRHGENGRLLIATDWDDVAALFKALTDPASRLPPPPLAQGHKRKKVGWRLPTSLPPNIHRRLRRASVLQRAAAVDFAHLLGLGGKGLTKPSTGASAPRSVASTPPLLHDGFEARVRPGDILFIPGAAWVHSDYEERLAALKERYDLHVALLLYDLIPVRRPEWCVRSLVDRFSTWIAHILPACDTLMAISEATAADIERYAREKKLTLAGPVKPIPMGMGFGPSPDAVEPAKAVRALGLPRPGSYVLFVSTLEARKNHILLFRLWRRLIEERGRDKVPDLVFAGRVGWLVADLMQQLDNTGWLDGKIRLIRDPSDDELNALYAGCMFTMFPSMFEGWGLPVTESLSLGRPCLCSDREALPEAGGSLARYFDPEDLNDAHAALTAILDDAALLPAWEARVRTEFKPRPWTVTAQAITDALPLAVVMAD